MADKVYVVGAYVSSDDPLLRIRTFVPLPANFATLGEAVAAAEQDYRTGETPEADASFVVYRSDGGDAVVEVSRGGPFRTGGFYKIALVEAGGE
ncbi:MAG TPA: hypothetical protein VMZ71_14960 [Gemmataceae bacterium]|nr:hypothetical protein [Gemmataceae bacterium]